MDSDCFDDLARVIGVAASRRALVRSAAAWLLAAGLPARALTSAAAQDASVPAAFFGRWSGGGTQVQPSAEWPVEFTVWSGAVGSVVGAVAYPSYGCHGELILVAAAPDGTAIDVAERITEGAGVCIDGGAFTLTMDGPDALTFAWSAPTGSTVARGTALSVDGRDAEPGSLGQMRVTIVACANASEARWEVSQRFGAVDTGPDCRGVDEPRRLAITGPDAGTQTMVETSGGAITLALGDYTLADEATGASTAFAMAPADQRGTCDGLPACGLAVLVVPDQPAPPEDATGPSQHDDASLAEPIPIPGVSTVVIFAPGIDPKQKLEENDPYEQARETFSPIIDRLGCIISPVGPPRCDGGMTWIPFSYGGIDPITGPRPYTGKDTGQPLQRSRDAMQDTIAYARSLAPGARIVVVGHSLGGAVAAFYGADDPAVQVVALDSPVNGIWTDDQAVLGRYCSDSSGLLGFRTGIACPRAIALEGLRSDVAGDLRRSEVHERMGRANVLNVANAVDLAVPSWYASNPASLRGTVLISQTCFGESIPEGVLAGKNAEDAFVTWGEFPQHICVVEHAADAVLEIVQANRWPRPSSRAATIPLTVVIADSGNTTMMPGGGQPPARADVRVLWPGQQDEITTTIDMPLGTGRATVDIPWRDVLVEITLYDLAGEPLWTYCRGALPGQNRALEVKLLLPEATPAACPSVDRGSVPEPPAAIGSYTVTDLGILPGTTSSMAADINAGGTVVGSTVIAGQPGDGRGFVWNDGAMSELGSWGAAAINDRGQIVGNGGGFEAGCQPIFWERGQETELPVIPGSFSTCVNGLNERGQVVGRGSFATIREPSLPSHAFLYENGAMVELGTFGGTDAEAFDINELGQIVGGADTADGIQRAFLYSDGVMTNLGALPGHEASVATAINDQGWVVGNSDFGFGGSGARGFLFRDGVMTDLGVLDGGNQTYAHDINAAGAIVGSSGMTAAGEGWIGGAFLYADGRMVDLNGLIPADSGWALSGANAINDAGQIVGSGTIDGQVRAFLLTPAAPADTLPPTSGRDDRGSTGLVAFTQDGSLHLTNEDGTYAAVIHAGNPPTLSNTDDSDHWYGWSPDGAHLAFLPVLADSQQPWPRPLLLFSADSSELVQLAEAAYEPAWSSGGRYLVYREPVLPAEPWGSRRTILVDVASGARQTLVEETYSFGFNVWALDGPELIYTDYRGLPADRRPRAFRTDFAETPASVPTFDLTEGCVNDPRPEDYEYLQDPAARLLMREAANWPQTARWSIDQNLLAYNVSCRLAILVNLATGETETRQLTQLALGPNGRMVVLEFGPTITSSTALDLTAVPSSMGLAPATLGATTEPLGNGHLPVWSADGSVLYFARRIVLSEYPPLSSTEFQGLRPRIRVCRSSLWRVNADGSGLNQLVELDAFGFGPVSPTPDGDALVFSSVDNSLALWEHRLSGDLFDDALLAEHAPAVRMLRLDLATGAVVTMAEHGSRPAVQPRLPGQAPMADPDIDVARAS